MKQLLSQPSLNPDVSKPGSLAAIKSLSTFQFIDILLTHTWPTSMTVATSTMPPDLQPEIAPQLDDLVRKVKPRYHFTSCGGKFWEREPFCWVEENNRTTRFVSLGSFGDQMPASGKKERVRCLLASCLQPFMTTQLCKSGSMLSRCLQQLRHQPHNLLPLMPSEIHSMLIHRTMCKPGRERWGRL
jgi:hypothetical protein